MTELTPDEEKVLRELAQNLMASTRIGKFLKSSLIWLASVIGAGYVVFEFFLKSRG